MDNSLRESYSYLFEEDLLQEIETVGKKMSVKEGEIIMEIGQPIGFIPLLLKGAIKILREDSQGDELLLYFIERGDTCTMTLNCCMEKAKSKIRAVAEVDTELLMIPVVKMEEWLTRYRSWLEFVLQSYKVRVDELFEVVDTIAFLKMDERLLKHLQDKAVIQGDDEVHTTHREIAYDLHTSRVVISRLLKSLERHGKIQLGRNFIKVLHL